MLLVSYPSISYLVSSTVYLPAGFSSSNVYCFVVTSYLKSFNEYVSTFPASSVILNSIALAAVVLSTEPTTIFVSTSLPLVPTLVFVIVISPVTGSVVTLSVYSAGTFNSLTLYEINCPASSYFGRFVHVCVHELFSSNRAATPETAVPA